MYLPSLERSSQRIRDSALTTCDFEREREIVTHLFLFFIFFTNSILTSIFWHPNVSSTLCFKFYLYFQFDVDGSCSLASVTREVMRTNPTAALTFHAGTE